MTGISIVIICKNEAAVIGHTLEKIKGVSDDIIVYDNGSTDETVSIVRQYPVRLEQGPWEGFGRTKNKACALAKHDWILSLDADETPDETLIASLRSFDGAEEKAVYDIRFKNFLGNVHLRFGEWGDDSHIRLFNRKLVLWNEAPVHEELIIPAGVSISKIKGAILHRTMKDIAEYAIKMAHYAELRAGQYFKNNKKASWYKIRVAPTFNFIKYYFFKGGFLDGHEGFVCAKMTAFYTFLKYSRLKEMYKVEEKKSLPHRHIDT
ncbi:MAG: glycosyltransferase family 2 protein [Chitinophagaceae bacterium]|nr:glycosyltransferase family 2 protein [Chitinophagaceae bacterium]